MHPRLLIMFTKINNRYSRHYRLISQRILTDRNVIFLTELPIF